MKVRCSAWMLASLIGAIKPPVLPYSHSALEPYVSTETLSYHFDKHHLGYYKKLQQLIEQGNDTTTAFRNATLEDIIEQSTGVLRNQAAQVYNHAFYWRSMHNGEGSLKVPYGPISELIDRDFGSFSMFQQAFNQTALGHFGSGWIWLIAGLDGKLQILEGHDATTPISPYRGSPLLCCDIWEHAYYIDYRNARGSYLDQWWNLVDWKWANTMLAQKYSYDEFN